MTYVYSFSYVSFFTRSHGQEKSSLYYDLFDFGVLLFYGRTPTLIFPFLLYKPTTPILPVYVDQRRTHLEKDSTRPRGMVIRQIATVPRRTFITPDTGGKGSITQWVHTEYMEGSKTIHPAFTQWVRGGYFSKVPTKVPTG